jgi:hypothetical protein
LISTLQASGFPTPEASFVSAAKPTGPARFSDDVAQKQPRSVSGAIISRVLTCSPSFCFRIS